MHQTSVSSPVKWGKRPTHLKGQIKQEDVMRLGAHWLCEMPCEHCCHHHTCVCTLFHTCALALHMISRVLVLFYCEIFKSRSRGLEFLIFYTQHRVGGGGPQFSAGWSAGCAPAISPATPLSSPWALQLAQPQSHTCRMMALFQTLWTPTEYFSLSADTSLGAYLPRLKFSASQTCLL